MEACCRLYTATMTLTLETDREDNDWTSDPDDPDLSPLYTEEQSKG